MSLRKRYWKYRFIFILLFPTIAYFLIFSYFPFYGIVIAFKDLQIFKGIWASPWVGFKHFETLFTSAKFAQLLKNTVLISVYRLVFGFPVPILFALLLNEVRIIWFKRVVQTITYFPHFLSWVIFGGIVFNFIGPQGIINLFLVNAGMEPIGFVTNPDYFRPIAVITGILKEFGWSAIIYLAALSAIDPQLYEAAKIDGAKKWRQIWHVTLPGIRSTIIMLFILSLASILDAGFEQVFILSNPSVLDVSDIIDTYVYRVGLLNANYGLATATGLFKGVVGAVLIITANFIIRRTGEKSLW
ncbi:ABC transporter permease [Paenibacillus eucommiae]|uniref:Aldouronate transport system permease protein n=1 Tax=Paenibacillus eucommiae TaxID=1355755 RepID=A0ABS4J683_9BACL|nr:ABC transporter permease subunit [Paenibacillus eucommiae]MBP1995333.1 putative aldouronate transport system permease protein [Paenibacillus eucommiae]